MKSMKVPTVSPTYAPAGTAGLGAEWIRIAVPDVGVLVAAVARPTGKGPFPIVLLLHGSHGFALGPVDTYRIHRIMAARVTTA